MCADELLPLAFGESADCLYQPGAVCNRAGLLIYPHSQTVAYILLSRCFFLHKPFRETEVNRGVNDPVVLVGGDPPVDLRIFRAPVKRLYWLMMLIRYW